jgi:hypothetical protein
MTQHLTFILEEILNSDIVDKYKCETEPDLILYIPHYLSRKENNIPKNKLKITLAKISNLNIK